MNGIDSIGARAQTLHSELEKKAPSSNDFLDRLKAAVTDVNQSQHASDQAVRDVVNGKLGVHEGMLRLQEADLSLRMLLQVRAKVMEAYREVMRLQF